MDNSLDGSIEQTDQETDAQDNRGESCDISEDESCAAGTNCKRPTNKRINWGSCNSCKIWYHMHCIYVERNQMMDKMEFTCKNCKSTKNGDQEQLTEDESSEDDVTCAVTNKRITPTGKKTYWVKYDTYGL